MKQKESYCISSGLTKTALNELLENNRRPLSVAETYSYRLGARTHDPELWNTCVTTGDVLVYHPKAGFKLGHGNLQIWETAAKSIHDEKRALYITDDDYDSVDPLCSFLKLDAIIENTPGRKASSVPLAENALLRALIPDDFERSTIITLACKEERPAYIAPHVCYGPMRVYVEFAQKSQRFPSMWFVEALPAFNGLRLGMSNYANFIGKLPEGFRSDAHIPALQILDQIQMNIQMNTKNLSSDQIAVPSNENTSAAILLQAKIDEETAEISVDF